MLPLIDVLVRAGHAPDTITSMSSAGRAIEAVPEIAAADVAWGILCAG